MGGYKSCILWRVTLSVTVCGGLALRVVGWIGGSTVHHSEPWPCAVPQRPCEVVALLAAPLARRCQCAPVGLHAIGYATVPCVSKPQLHPRGCTCVRRVHFAMCVSSCFVVLDDQVARQPLLRERNDRLAKDLLAGALSGSITKTAIAPLERVKILLQIQASVVVGAARTDVYECVCVMDAIVVLWWGGGVGGGGGGGACVCMWGGDWASDPRLV